MTTPLQLTPSADCAHSTDLADELLRIRERFSAYERLDQQFAEMVGGLTELLQGATEMRRRTNEDITGALTRLEFLIASDNQRQTRLLTGLHAELAAAHQRTAALSTSLTDVQRTLTALAARLPIDIGDTNSGSDSDSEDSSGGEKTPRSRLVTIREVPDLATALIIQRAFAKHRAVSAIHTREFAAGELRLHVELSAPLTVLTVSSLVSGALIPEDQEGDRLILRYRGNGSPAE